MEKGRHFNQHSSQLIHEDSTPSLRSGPVQEEEEAQEEEEEGRNFYQQLLSDQH